MKIKNPVVFLSGFFLILVCSSNNFSAKEKIFVTNYDNVLGTSLELKIHAQSDEAAENAETAALATIDRLDLRMSSYKSNSEFNRWLKAPHTPFHVSAELFEVLGLFEKWKVKSKGALDPSAAVVINLWKNAAKQNLLPSKTAISSAVKAVQHQHYTLDSSKQTVQRNDDVPLIINSFTKSYIIGKAAQLAMDISGISGVVINLGGDIVLRGSREEMINIADPRADAENDPPISRIKVMNKAVATSGNYRRGVLIANTWYSHIVDPRTGYPSSEVISSTVVADNPADAGALATTLSVVKPSESKLIAAQLPGAEYLIILRNGSRVQSNGWSKLETPVDKPVPIKPVSNPDKLWDQNFELLIAIELPELEGYRTHRPYVAVWVVSPDNKPVRSIALWYNKSKYLDEMHAWYATYYKQFSEPGTSLTSSTSATRAAGAYSLKWDGKDDSGNLVPRGKYTVFIEAAREHGTYQLTKQEMEFEGKPATVNLAGNTEIKSLSLQYRKKELNAR